MGLLLQVVTAEMPIPQMLSIAARLLMRITGDVPATDLEVRRVLQALFARCEHEPCFPDFFCKLIGVDDGCAETADSGGSHCDPTGSRTKIAPRVALIANKLL